MRCFGIHLPREDEHVSGKSITTALCKFILEVLPFAFKTFAPKVPEMKRFCVSARNLEAVRCLIVSIYPISDKNTPLALQLLHAEIGSLKFS